MSYPCKKLNTLAKILKIIEKWMCVLKKKNGLAMVNKTILDNEY